MKVCENCGAIVNDNESACLSCGYKFENKPSIQNEVKKTGNMSSDKFKQNFMDGAGKVFDASAKAYSTAKKYSENYATGLRDGYILTEGETLIKEYNVMKVGFLPFLAKNCYLAVTNKRVIFYGAYLWGRANFSIPLENVTDVNFFYGWKVKRKAILWYILSLLITWLLVNQMLVSETVGWIATTVILILLFAKTVYISLGTGGKGAPFTVGSFESLDESFFFSQAWKGPEYKKAEIEVSAMVIDLKQNGDRAIEKWRQ